MNRQASGWFEARGGASRVGAFGFSACAVLLAAVTAFFFLPKKPTGKSFPRLRMEIATSGGMVCALSSSVLRLRQNAQERECVLAFFAS